MAKTPWQKKQQQQKKWNKETATSTPVAPNGPVCFKCGHPIPEWPRVSVCSSCGQQN